MGFFSKLFGDDDNGDALSINKRANMQNNLGDEIVAIIETILKPSIKEQIRASFERNHDQFVIYSHSWEREYDKAGGPSQFSNRSRYVSSNEKKRMMLTAFNMGCFELKVQKDAVSLGFDTRQKIPENCTINWKSMTKSSKDYGWKQHYNDLHRDPLRFIED